MKKICDSPTLKNAAAPDCLTGSPFMDLHSHNLMAGEIQNKNIKISNDDNFHLAYTVYPYHHP